MSIRFKKIDDRGLLPKYYFTLIINEFETIDFYTNEQSSLIKIPYYQTPQIIKTICDEFTNNKKLIKELINKNHV